MLKDFVAHFVLLFGCCFAVFKQTMGACGMQEQEHLGYRSVSVAILAQIAAVAAARWHP
jgi:hypothetical protein